MYKNNINLNLYKDFYAVCKNGSLAKAAEATFTSPPAISKSIKKLESELNRDLFYRKPKGMELTSYGKQLLYYVEKSFNNLETAQRCMIEEDSLKRGKIAIGMPSNIGSFFLYDKIIDFHKQYPNIEITIITGGTSKLIKLLETHVVDFVIDTSPINIESSEGIIIKKLDKVQYVFIIKKGSKNDIKSIQDLKNKQLILPIKHTANRNDLDEVFNKNHIKDLNILNLHTSEMIISAVKKNLGIGYVIKNLIEKEKDIDILNIKEQLPTSIINIVYNPKYLTTAPKRFINTYIDRSINF